MVSREPRSADNDVMRLDIIECKVTFGGPIRDTMELCSMVSALVGGITKLMSSAYLRRRLFNMSAFKSDILMTKLAGAVPLP